jgi:hypothetical protein
MTSLEQGIEGLDSDHVSVHVHTPNIAHEAQAQHISTVSNFADFVPVGIYVLRQRHLVNGAQNERSKAQRRECQEHALQPNLKHMHARQLRDVLPETRTHFGIRFVREEHLQQTAH